MNALLFSFILVNEFERANRGHVHKGELKGQGVMKGNYIHQPELFLTLLLTQDVSVCICLTTVIAQQHLIERVRAVLQ